MKIKIYFSFILIIFELLQFSNGYLVIPFHYLNERKNTDYNFNDITGKEFLELTTNKLVSTISMGSPLKSLEIYLTMDYNLFFIGKGYCEKNSISFYEPAESSSFKNDQFYSYPFDDLRNMTIGNDSCTLFNDYNLKSNTTLKGVNLLYGTKINILNDIYYKDKVCGVLGLKLHLMQDSYYLKFRDYSWENSLKANNISNNTDWTIEFFTDEEKKKKNGFDGYLILGAGSQQYLKNIKKIDEENLKTSITNTVSNAIEWSFSLKNIYYTNQGSENKTMVDNFKHIQFMFDLDYYFVTKQYFDLIKNDFFSSYLSSGVCTVHKLKEFYLRYQFISCEKSFNKEIPKFPTLYFENYYYNYIFNLTYKDCFKEINNRVLFLLFYDPWGPDTFKVGKNFMKKYQFIFDSDKRLIGFLNHEINGKNGEGDNKEEQKEKKKKLEKKQLVWIIILVVLLVGIVIGVLVGKKLWDKNRKKRANELLDDDYEYDSKEKQNIN